MVHCNEVVLLFLLHHVVVSSGSVVVVLQLHCVSSVELVLSFEQLWFLVFCCHSVHCLEVRGEIIRTVLCCIVY